MSLTMTKADGVTVLTLTSDPCSPCPPLCQILRGLCYTPVSCSVSQRLRGVEGISQSVLGTLHTLVGLLNIGLAMILLQINGAFWWQMPLTMYPFWLGGIFILLGIFSILSEKYPSPCLVILTLILNLLAGVAFAITAVVLYSFNLLEVRTPWICDGYYGSHDNILSPTEVIMRNKCFKGIEIILLFSRGINAVLIFLSVLELCVVISSGVLSIKALKRSDKREDQSTNDPEHYTEN